MTGSHVTTPESRERDLDFEHFKGSTRDKVKNTDPNGGVCLLKNTPTHVVDYCHCIPRAFMKSNKGVLDSLEWAWNLRRFSLHLDTRYNIFCLNEHLHRLFDNGAWLLIPQDDIIKKYCDACQIVGFEYFPKRERFPEFPERNTFLYKFVPVKAMETEEIYRRNDLPLLENQRLSSEHYNDYHFPFDTFPLLQSHLHPKFVIFDAGRKLATLRGDSLQDLYTEFPSLRDILPLYRGWILPPPPEHLHDPTYTPLAIPEDDDISSDDDDSKDEDYDDTRTNATKFRRPGYKRKAPAVAPIPYPIPSDKQRHSNLGWWQVGGKRKVLSEMSLSTHNQQLGTANWDDRIRDWPRSLNCTKKKTKKKRRYQVSPS